MRNPLSLVIGVAALAAAATAIERQLKDLAGKPHWQVLYVIEPISPSFERTRAICGRSVQTERSLPTHRPAQVVAPTSKACLHRPAKVFAPTREGTFHRPASDCAHRQDSLDSVCRRKERLGLSAMTNHLQADGQTL